MRALSLFTGYGGIDLALKEYITEVVAYVEIEEYAQKIIAYRMAEGSLRTAPILADVKNVKGDIGACDIIYGGFPCQDLSVAGNGKGLEGERSGLFYEVIRLTKEIRPSFVFLENVPAIRTRGLDQVIKEFTEMGYDCRWTMLSAESVGACHKRERWFLLAHNRCERGQGIGQEQIQGKRTLQRSKNVGRDQNFHRRPDLYEPKLCRSLHDVTFGMDRIKAIGNGVVPLQVKTAFEKLIGMGHTFL